MKFDINKVYSAVNAEELKIGSRCIFADTMEELENAVKNKQSAYIRELDCVLGKSWQFRFGINVFNRNGSPRHYSLAYLIEHPKVLVESPIEPNYCSFCNTETAFKIITAHGCWVKNKQGQHYFITAIDIGGEDECEIMIGADWISNERLFRNYVFADDSSPCGELMEE